MSKTNHALLTTLSTLVQHTPFWIASDAKATDGIVTFLEQQQHIAAAITYQLNTQQPLNTTRLIAALSQILQTARLYLHPKHKPTTPRQNITLNNAKLSEYVTRIIPQTINQYSHPNLDEKKPSINLPQILLGFSLKLAHIRQQSLQHKNKQVIRESKTYINNYGALIHPQAIKLQHKIAALQASLTNFSELILLKPRQTTTIDYQEELPTTQNYIDMTATRELNTAQHTLPALRNHLLVLKQQWVNYLKKITLVKAGFGSYFLAAIRIQRIIHIYQQWQRKLTKPPANPNKVDLSNMYQALHLLVYEKERFITFFREQQRCDTIINQLLNFLHFEEKQWGNNLKLTTPKSSKKHHLNLLKKQQSLLTHIDKQENSLPGKHSIKNWAHWAVIMPFMGLEKIGYNALINSTLPAVNKISDTVLSAIDKGRCKRCLDSTDVILNRFFGFLRLFANKKFQKVLLTGSLNGILLSINYYLGSTHVFLKWLAVDYAAKLIQGALSRIDSHMHLGNKITRGLDILFQSLVTPALELLIKIANLNKDNDDPERIQIVQMLRDTLRFDHLGILEKKSIIHWLCRLAVHITLNLKQKAIPTTLAYAGGSLLGLASDSILKTMDVLPKNQALVSFAFRILHTLTYPTVYGWVFSTSHTMLYPPHITPSSIDNRLGIELRIPNHLHPIEKTFSGLGTISRGSSINDVVSQCRIFKIRHRFHQNKETTILDTSKQTLTHCEELLTHLKID